MISFKASHLNTVTVQRNIFFDLYGDYNASLVEFNRKFKPDKQSLKETAAYWKALSGEKNGTFANDIYDDFIKNPEYTDDIYDDFIKNPEYTDDNENYFIGLTTQTDSFERIDPNLMLGLAEITHLEPGRFDESDVHILDYILTVPNSRYGIQGRTYKQAGTRLLDYIISRFAKIPLVLIPTLFSEKFYIEHGFKYIKNSDVMILKK